MELDDITISRAITESFMKDFMDAMEVEVAIVGAGPAGSYAARCIWILRLLAVR